MAGKKLTYKDAFSKLQSIVHEIEQDKPDIDELSSKLKEAAELLKICKDKLFVASEETRKMLEELQ